MSFPAIRSIVPVLILLVSIGLLTGVGAATAAEPVRLEQIISREDPRFNCTAASLTIGRDGMVYLTSAGQDNGYILRVSRDGADKLGGASVPAIHNATADKNGLIASSNGHFSHQVALYDREFAKITAVTDFLVNDQVGWDAPGSVEAGAGGDFYALDHHRDRIVQINADGKTVKAYPFPHIEKAQAQSFRVCEKAQAFYISYMGADMRCLGFDGKTRWSRGIGAGSNTWEGDSGGFDVDEDGVLYAIGSHENTIRKYALDGNPAGQIKLDIPIGRRSAEPIHGLHLWGGEVLIRFRHPSELFQVYDLSTGRFKHAASISHERLTVTLGSGAWVAGSQVDFRIDFDAGGQPIKPAWRVWARPFGVLDYRELKVADGKLNVPADFAGLYQVKVTPEVTPWQQGGTTSEYKVGRLVEVRSPGCSGSIAAATVGNRVWFGRGEEIPFSILLHAPAAQENAEVAVAVTDGTQVYAASKIRLVAGSKEMKLTLPGWWTARLRLGKYTINVTAAGLTPMSQPLVIGPGLQPASILTIQYGDYRSTYPHASPWDAPDIVTAAIERNRRLGFNLMVDRLGHPQQMDAILGKSQRGETDAAYKTLDADPVAAVPAKLRLLPTAVQTITGYGATGASQMAILLGMDAPLPLDGPGHDGRKPEQMVKDLATVTEALKGYPGFRGWTWSSNWWVYANRGAKAARTPQEKSAFEAALKKAAATGAWDEILDTVAGYRFAYAADAVALFNAKLKELAPGKVATTACPFRNVDTYPPVTLANIDETDLQAQWEQVAMPLHSPINVDFYKRPGKKAWGHPEVWNDAGTGDQILTTLWQLIMRGADGVGCSDPVPQWHFALRGNTDDPRLAWNGITTVYRNLNAVLARYGPWLASMHNHDSVAIVVSGRMSKIDDWAHVFIMGQYFARVMEAYIACLHAHLPAGIVFADDLKPDTLTRYKAVLVVDQTVEMEPPLAAALKAAQAAGVKVFADGTCRPELDKDFTPLGFSFDKLEKVPSAAADDHAYWRIAACAKSDALLLGKALAGITTGARVENPEVFLSERRDEDGRYIFVVNNTVPGELEPGHLWRVTLASASLVPQIVPVKLDATPGQTIYDVFAGKAVVPGTDGTVPADCRDMPARLFAVLPAAIAQVEIKAPRAVAPGDRIRWEVRIQDAAGKVIAAGVPIRVRLLAGDGGVLDERYGSANSKGAAGEFVVPLGLAATPVTIEASELLSGRSATLPVTVPDAKITPFDIAAGTAQPAMASPALDASTTSAQPAADFSSAEESFGPHVRDLVITDGGKLAVLNTMNWDHNLYGVDLQTGQTRWRQRAGHYFAFDPAALSDGIAVQGFDLKSAQGYHLYRVGADGGLQRRFALYGLPQRLPHRFVPALVRDHINSFAAGDDGNWIATAGDLGLAVWSADGKVLWQQDWFKKQRHPGKIVALDAATLLVIEGMTATAYAAPSGQQKWQISLGRSGEIRIARVSADSRTCVLYTTADGGKLLVLRDGKIARTIPTSAEDFGLSADGSMIAVVAENLVKLYSVADGLKWILHGDDLMHFPRFSGDGRLAATSALGTVYVTDLAGKILLEKDLHALAVPAWLTDGNLVLATWEGTICRLDRNYTQRWRTRLTPQATDMRGRLLADDATPTSAISGWTNAAAKSADISDNLLAKTTPLIRLVTSSGPLSLSSDSGQKVSMLYDGKPDAPAQPWIPWHHVGTFAETSPVNSILIDAFRTQMRVTGVTLVEDPAHPETWLRDASIEYWDAAKESWVYIQPLLSNAPVHTHMFAKPIEAARFRLMLPWGVCGNVKLAEIAFHGDLLACSHPDVAAKRPVAVLFDEQQDIKDDLMHSGNGLAFALQGAFSGGRCLSLIPTRGAQTVAGPPWREQFGESIRNWDFEIVENPAPGQYRYLQFAWKALSSETKGMTLRLSENNFGGISAVAGEPTPLQGATVVQQPGAPPAEWQVVRLDLWALAKKPWRIRSLNLGVRGGGAAFDQILLGRNESDLPPSNRH